MIRPDFNRRVREWEKLVELDEEQIAKFRRLSGQAVEERQYLTKVYQQIESAMALEKLLKKIEEFEEQARVRRWNKPEWKIYCAEVGRMSGVNFW